MRRQQPEINLAGRSSVEIVVAAENGGDFQRAITRASAVNGTVELRAGQIYAVSATLVIPGNVRIRGYGATIDASAVSAGAIFDVRSARFELLGPKVDGAIVDVVDLNNSPGVERLVVADCEFTNIGAAAACIVNGGKGTFTTAGPDVDRVSIERNRFEDTGFAAVCLNCNYRNVQIRNNVVRRTFRYGFVLGLDLIANQPTMERAIVTENILEEIGDPADAANTACNGILVYGRRVTISNNLIDTVQNLSEADCEGIYTKAIEAEVFGNILHNAGYTEGSITCKGSELGEVGATKPAGYGAQVWGNSITSSGRALINGIITVNSEAHVWGNRIKGAFRGYISHNNEDGLSGASIHDNEIFGDGTGFAATGATGIAVSGECTNVSIRGNRVLNLGQGGVTDRPKCIDIDASIGPLGRVVVEGNILGQLNGVAPARIIDIDASNTIDELVVRGNHLVAPATFGIQVTSTPANITKAWIEDNELDPAITTPVENTTLPFVDAQTKFANNSGFPTENQGIATVAAASTIATVTHGCERTPTRGQVVAVPAENLGTAAKFWVTNITATQFEIRLDAAPGANTNFDWRVDRDAKTL